MSRNLLLVLFTFSLLSSSAFAALKTQQIFKTSYGPILLVDLRSTPEYAEAHQINGLTAVPDYADVGTIYIEAGGMYADGYKNVLSMIKHLPPQVAIMLYGSRDAFNHFNLNFLGINGDLAARPENSVFYRFVEPQNSEMAIPRWSRDHLGVPVKYKGWRNEDLVGYVSAIYRFNSQPSDSLYLGVSKIRQISAWFEWGNYLIMGNRAYVIDGPRLPKNLNLAEFAYTGVDEVVVLPRPFLNGDPNQVLGVPHVDEFMIALSDNEVLTNDAEFKAFFETQGLRAGILPSNADLGFDIFSYANGLIANYQGQKMIFLSTYASFEYYPSAISAEHWQKVLTDRDAQAVKAFEDFGYRVITIESPDFPAYTMGGIHCATRGWPVDPNASKNPGFFTDVKILK